MIGRTNRIKTILRYLITQDQVVSLPIHLSVYSQSNEDRGTEFSTAVNAQAARKRKAKRDGKRSIWFGLGMSGLIGWSVIVPTVIGAAIGAWIDHNYSSRYSWTLMLMLLGLIIGCASAWRWVASELQGKPVRLRLLPMDKQWIRRLVELPWPTKNLPQVVGQQHPTLSALVREYLFVSLFKACAESLASENASRLAAMTRAEKNIGEMIEGLNQTFRRLRQASIDEELFDVVSGYESLSKE